MLPAATHRTSMKLRHLLLLPALAASFASAQEIISDTFTDALATDSLWSKNLAVVPDTGRTPGLSEDTTAGTLTFDYRATIFSNVNLPSNHQGSISFEFEPAGSELLSVGLRGSSVRDSGRYGAFYGVVLEFHQYLNQLRVMDYSATGAATQLGAYSFDFVSGGTYSFNWKLAGSELSVSEVGGSTFDFTGVTAGAGNKLFINNSQDGAGLVLYDVSVSAIPEPATYAAVVGVFAAVAVVYARRRQHPSPALAGPN